MDEAQFLEAFRKVAKDFNVLSSGRIRNSHYLCPIEVLSGGYLSFFGVQSSAATLGIAKPLISLIVGAADLPDAKHNHLRAAMLKIMEESKGVEGP